jgi:hypothetical protein
MRDVTAAFTGISISYRDLISKVHEYGWILDKIESKKDGFVVKLKNESGQKLEEKASNVREALANALLSIASENARFSANGTWVHQLVPLATAYAKAPLFDYKAAVGWKALADDAISRKSHIEDQLKVEYTYDPVPYKSGQEMSQDIKKGKIKVPITDLDDHPIWTPDQVLAHRLCHYVLGRANSHGNDWAGTNKAVSSHLPYLSNEAQRALFSENLAKRAHEIHLGYTPTRIAYFNEFLNPGNKASEPPENTFAPSQLSGNI